MRRIVSVASFLFVALLVAASILAQDMPRRIIIVAGQDRVDPNAPIVKRLGAKLDELKIPRDDWRWVIIEDGKRWNRAADNFGTRRAVPAFSHLETKTTYVNSRLLLLNAKSFELLDMCLIHEYEHRLGGTERDAECRTWSAMHPKNK